MKSKNESFRVWGGGKASKCDTVFLGGGGETVQLVSWWLFRIEAIDGHWTLENS